MAVADATTEFFDDLSRRGHDPLLERVTATFRFDLVHGGKTDRWLVTVTKGDLAVSRQNRKADCVLRADQGAVRPAGQRRAERDGCRPSRRGSPRGRPDGCSCSSSGSSPDRPRPVKSRRAVWPCAGVDHERGPRQDPRRQHVRRQRPARRHRGVADRFHGTVLVRHPLPLEVGADGRTGSGSAPSRWTTCSTSKRASSSFRGRARSTSTPSSR